VDDSSAIPRHGRLERRVLLTRGVELFAPTIGVAFAKVKVTRPHSSLHPEVMALGLSAESPICPTLFGPSFDDEEPPDAWGASATRRRDGKSRCRSGFIRAGQNTATCAPPWPQPVDVIHPRFTPRHGWFA